MATHSNILAWKIPWDRGAWRATIYGAAQSQTLLSVHTHTHTLTHTLTHRDIWGQEEVISFWLCVESIS